MNVDELLKILACPECHGELSYLEDSKCGFLCSHCQLVYPIDGEIVLMLKEDAIPLEKWPDAFQQ